jgi:hypothetical protein
MMVVATIDKIVIIDGGPKATPNAIPGFSVYVSLNQSPMTGMDLDLTMVLSTVSFEI